MSLALKQLFFQYIFPLTMCSSSCCKSIVHPLTLQKLHDSVFSSVKCWGLLHCPWGDSPPGALDAAVVLIIYQEETGVNL